MKNVLIFLMSVIVVFCLFTGWSCDCSQNQKQDKPQYYVVDPINDGGSFEGGNNN